MRTGMASGDEFGSPHIRVRLPVARLATSVSGCCLYMWPAAPSVTRRVRGSSVGASRFYRLLAELLMADHYCTGRIPDTGRAWYVRAHQLPRQKEK